MHSLSPCLVRHLALFDFHLHLKGVKVVLPDALKRHFLKMTHRKFRKYLVKVLLCSQHLCRVKNILFMFVLVRYKNNSYAKCLVEYKI